MRLGGGGGGGGGVGKSNPGESNFNMDVKNA